MQEELLLFHCILLFCTAALQPQEMLLMDQLCRTISLRIEQTSGIITMLFANSSGEAQRKR